MKRISDTLINEKLKLDKNTKVFNSKPLLELVEGDKLYHYYTYIEYRHDEDDEFINNKIMTSAVTLVEKRTNILKETYLDIVFIDDFNKKHEGHVSIPIEELSKDTKLFYNKTFSSDTYSTDKSLLESIIEEKVADRIAPYQKRIQKLQEQINNILKLKEEKYYKEE